MALSDHDTHLYDPCTGSHDRTVDPAVVSDNVVVPKPVAAATNIKTLTEFSEFTCRGSSTTIRPDISSISRELETQHRIAGSDGSPSALPYELVISQAVATIAARYPRWFISAPTGGCDETLDQSQISAWLIDIDPLGWQETDHAVPYQVAAHRQIAVSVLAAVYGKAWQLRAKDRRALHEQASDHLEDALVKSVSSLSRKDVHELVDSIYDRADDASISNH